jgi:hypothetical protein
MEPRNRFQGMNSAKLCSLAVRYDNPIPTRCLAPIYCLKIPALLLFGFLRFLERLRVFLIIFFFSIQSRKLRIGFLYKLRCLGKDFLLYHSGLYTVLSHSRLFSTFIFQLIHPTVHVLYKDQRVSYRSTCIY